MPEMVRRSSSQIIIKLSFMPVNNIAYQDLTKELIGSAVSLVAVSKLKSPDEILELYQLGQRDFGENYVQELCEKQAILPKDIRWHFIGHLQSNKVKYIAAFVHLVQGVDSFRLLKEINKQAARAGRVIECLLQVHIAEEETKFGFGEEELKETFSNPDLPELQNIHISGLMGMASFTAAEEKIRLEFRKLKSVYNVFSKMDLPNCRFSVLSMGMSGDYRIAMEEGSSMVRIGTLLFGQRTAKK
jgi:pyridoxal phosphate enzyme (YggS family)